MADTLPVSGIARLDADLQMLALKREVAERTRSLLVAEQKYEVQHLDADSLYPGPDSYSVDYLHLGSSS